MTTDQLAAALLASLEKDAAEIRAIGEASTKRRAPVGHALVGPAQTLIARIGEICGVPHRDMSTKDPSATFEAGLQWARDNYGPK